MARTGKYPSVLIFGCPGSGKGTQGQAIGQVPNIVHLAMGDIFRGLDKTSEIGQEFLSYSTKGQLVPDEDIVKVLRDEIIKRDAMEGPPAEQAAARIRRADSKRLRAEAKGSDGRMDANATTCEARSEHQLEDVKAATPAQS